MSTHLRKWLDYEKEDGEEFIRAISAGKEYQTFFINDCIKTLFLMIYNVLTFLKKI